MPDDNMLIHTGNCDIHIHFFIVIPICVQKVTIQLQLLICDTKARAGILFWKGASNQIGCWQDYTNRIMHVKQLTILLTLEKGVTILTIHDNTDYIIAKIHCNIVSITT